MHTIKVGLFILCLPAAVMAQSTVDDVATISDKPVPRYLVETFGGAFGVAPGSTARPLAHVGLDLIKTFEGWFPNFYNDPAGYCTIGYGHLIALRECSEQDLSLFDTPLSLAEGLELLDGDTRGARIDVQGLVTGAELNENQFAALVSFTFNVGGGNFRNSTLLRVLNDDAITDDLRWELASREFPRWVYADGMLLNGLVARRSCERALFDGLIDGESAFNRSDCDSLGIAPITLDFIDIFEGE